VLKGQDQKSLLLLYLADELSVPDRAAVARMLEADAGLRDELAGLEAAQQAFEDSMAFLDSAPVSSESAAVRRIGQAMRQHMADQLRRPGKTAIVAHSRSRYPLWAYPSAAAAVVAISFLSWWGHRSEMPLKIAVNNTPQMSVPGNPPVPSHAWPAKTGVATGEPTRNINQGTSGQTPVAAGSEDSAQPDPEASPNTLGEVNLTQPKESVVSLYAAEDEVAELSRSRAQTFGFSLGNE
jgi:hypothetical protein